jgi:hypothetical protein
MDMKGHATGEGEARHQPGRVAACDALSWLAGTDPALA